MNEGAPSVTSIEEIQAVVDEFNLQRIFVAFLRDLKNIELLDKDPAIVFKDLVAKLRDKPEVIPASEALALKGRQESVLDSSEVEPLEAFLVAKAIMQDRTVTEFEKSDGSAIDSFSPLNSIGVIRDSVRTKRFLQAVENAVIKKATTQEEIFVCDAGCGALAILGIQAALASSKVRCVCIEKNKLAVPIARALVDAFGLSERVHVIQADATTYISEQQFDIIVSETMDTGLTSEPICEILGHLKQYLKEEGTFIPQRIDVYGAVMSPQEYLEADNYTHIDNAITPVLDFDWKKIGSYEAGSSVPEFEGVLPALEGEKLILVTSQVILGSDVGDLIFNESRLSNPQPVNFDIEGNFNDLRDEHGPLKIQYQAGQSPSSVIVNGL